MIHRFPEKGTEIKEILEHLEISKQDVNLYAPQRLRQYSTRPEPLAIDVLRSFQPHNWNNIGMHTIKKVFARGTRELEQEVIYMMGDLLGSQKIDGYITQGGTEGNIMGLWLGRNYLREKDEKKDNPIFLKTCIAHHSIDKASDLLGLKNVINISLNKNGGMSLESLERTLRDENAKGRRTFLLALALGYNRTGTVDPVSEIDLILGKLKKEIGIEYFVHLDAAIGGLIYPFLGGPQADFKVPSINSISVDLHKTGYLPQTAGIFLCRKGIINHIVRPAPYLLGSKVDATLSGSRPGSAAAAAWAVIKSLGREGYAERVRQCMELKKYFIKLLKEKKVPFSYIGSPCINIATFEFSGFPQKKLPKDIERKYGIVNILIPEILGITSGYNIVFMHHLTRNALKEFSEDLMSHV